MIQQVKDWFEKRALLQPRNVVIAPVSFLEEDANPDEEYEIQGVSFNGELAIVQNQWGHKAGQIAFGIYMKYPTGWSQVNNHDVEWRGPKRETKTPEELEVAYTKALHETLIEVVSMLLERDCQS